MFTKMALQDTEVASTSQKKDEINPWRFVSNPSVTHIWSVDVWVYRIFVTPTPLTMTRNRKLTLN